MKRIATVLVILLAFALPSLAQNVTQSVLEAKPVRQFIRLKLLDNNDGNTKDATPKILNYAIDSFNILDMKPLTGVSFRVEDDILILLADHNPLTEIYTVKRTRTPDPNHEALAAFLEQIKSLQAALPQPIPLAAGGGGAETADQRRARIRATCEQKHTVAADRNRCVQETEDEEACALFATLINDALNALNQRELDPDSFATDVKNATGHTGVENFRSTVESIRRNIKTNNDIVRDRFKQISATFGPEELGKPPLRTCPDITSLLLINYTELLARAEAVIARKEQLSAELLKIHKSLDDYANGDKWRGATDTARTDYIATSVKPTAEEQENVAVTVHLQDIAANQDKTGFVTSTVKGSNASGDFPVRRDSFFTIERAAAVVYNTLEYPEYGTGLKDGITVVKKKEDRKPIDAALMFNFIPRLPRISGAYPMFQVGFSTAKDLPGLLAGVGLRIVGRFPVSLSVGGMITRYKDLDGTLKEDDPVEGTAQINDHLVYKTSPVKVYGAIQVKF
jgi:hypothetical protein